MRYLAIGLFLLVAGSANLAAQQLTPVRGRVVAGVKPVGGQPVSLHRVTAEGGQTISADTTADDGSFTLLIDSLHTSGVNFVATRYEDRLYIGDTFRDSLPADYVLRVGPGATPIDLNTAAPAAPVAPPPQSNRAGLVVILSTLLAASVVALLLARRRRSPTRQLLVEVADLDVRNEARPSPGYAEVRKELIRRLRESA